MNLIAQRLIEAEMKLAGVQPEHRDILAAVASQQLRQNEDGEIEVLDSTGNVRIGASTENMTVSEWLAELKAKSPILFAPPPAAQAKSAPATTMTERMTSEVAAQRSSASGALQAEEIAAKGNPWSKSSWNFTRQGLISNLHPELAASLKANAS